MIDIALVCPCHCGQYAVHGHLVLHLNTKILVFPFWSKAAGIELLGTLSRSKVIDQPTLSKTFTNLETTTLPFHASFHSHDLKPFAFDLQTVHAS